MITFFHKHILFLLAAFACVNNSKAQTNACGVAARIVPASSDSIVSLNTLIHFSSASFNAVSVKWLMDGLFSGNTAPSFNYVVSAGAHTISLVAYSGNCTDTTTVIYFCAGTPHAVDSSLFANYGLFDTFEYGTCIDATPDGGFVLGGYGTLINNHNCGHQGLVVKLRDKGCVDWSKQIRDTLSYCGYGDVNLVYASSFDSSYYVQGDGFLMKLDKNGNQSWTKKLVTDTYGYYFNTSKITGDPQGNIYLIANSIDFGWMITKLSASGNILWSKYYHILSQDPNQLKDFANAFGILWMNGKLFISGAVIKYVNTEFFDFLIRIDATTGATDWQYGYKNPVVPNAISFSEPSAYGSLIMIAGTDGGGQGVYLFDQQGNIGKTIKAQFNTSYSPRVTKARADKDGNIYMMQWTEETLSLQPYFYYYTNFVKFDTSLNKYWGLVYPKWYFQDMTIGKNDFAAIGTDFGFETSGITGSLDMRFLKVNQKAENLSNYDGHNSCNYYTQNYTLTTMPVTRMNFKWGVDSVLKIDAVPAINYILPQTCIFSQDIPVPISWIRAAL